MRIDARQLIFGLEEALISGFTLQSGHSYSASGYMTGPVDSMAGGAAVLGGMLSNCVVKHNRAITGGGIGFISFAENHQASISQCRIYSNTASYAGGMIAWGALTADNCEIRYNESSRTTETGSGRAGGCELLSFKTQGMDYWNVPVLRNCWIGENYAENDFRGGGGIYMDGGHLVNCTILNNRSRSAGGGLYFESAETNVFSVVNTLIYYNEGVGYPNYYDSGSALTFDSCCSTPVADGLMTNEPLVAGINNAHLLPASPLRGAGDASAVLEGAADIDGEARLDSGQVDIGCDQVYPENMTNSFLLSYEPALPKVVAGKPLALSALSAGRLMNLLWSVDTNGGNYTVSNAVQIAPVWQQAGSYNVRLSATNLNGGRMIIDTVTVMDGFTNYVSRTGAHISPFTNLAEAATNIQAAVDACYEGGTVLIDDGTYALYDQGAVQITHPVTLAGMNGWTNVVVTRNAASKQRMLVMDHEDAVVQGITLQNGGGVNFGGGAMLYAGILQDSCIRSNRAEMAGGGVKVQGSAHIRRCRFEGNESDGEGGAVYAGQNAVIENCVFYDNMAHGQAGEGGGGGGAAFMMDSAVLRNSFLSDNSAWTAGGVLLYSGGTIQNCTILRNHSYGMAGGVLNGMGAMYNNIIYYNTAQTYPNYYNKSDDACYNCTVPELEGTGNITNLPALMGKHNPHIVAASPCFNGGSGDYVGYSETDIDNEVRTYDGRVDIGCDEYIPTNIIGTLTVNIEGESGTLVDDDVELFADISGRAQGYCWFITQDDGSTQAVVDTYMITPVWSVTGSYPVVLVASNLDGGVCFTQSVQVVNTGFTNYVSSTGTHVSPFTSWAMAATNVQAAVDACYAHGTVLVASGVYTQHSTLNINVPVSVCGAGNDRNAVVLDGGGSGRVVSMTHTAAVLSGVTLCRGTGDHGAGIMMTAGTVSNCVITACGELENDEEAGAYVLGDSLMTHCSISSNKAVTVGGVRLSNRARLEYSEVNFNETKYDAAGLLLEHDAVAQFCEIKGNLAHLGFAGGVFFNQGGTVDYTMIHSNAASQGVGATFMKGGALSNSVIELSWAFFNAAGFWMENGGVIDNCLIQSNIAYSGNGGGGLISTYGQIKDTLFRGNAAVSAAGVKLQNGGEISDCVFEKNEAKDYRDLKASAGALEFLNDGSADRCQFIGNHSDRDGGAVHLESGGVIRNSLFAGNTAGTKGGGAYLCVNPNALQQSAFLYGCTFAGNTAGEEGGGVWLNDKGEVYNSILYGNSAGTNAQYGVDEYNSAAKMNNTCADPLWFREGTNNITDDPVFANAATGNYRLTSGSPCVNSGDKMWLGSYQDLVNDPRLIGTNVDMGCYEYTLAPDGFSATVDARTVNLAWNGVTGAQGYNVYRSRTPDSHCKLVASLGAGVTNWQDTGRCSGSIYYFVRAAYGGEDGEATETKQVRLVTVYLDFDGDGKADITVYWPEQGMWYILQSSNQTERVQSWGWADAQPVPGDYDGDGKVDVAVYNAQQGSWLILQSSNMTMREQAWGGPDFEPVAADYDGDGKADVAVFDAVAGTWLIWQSETQSMRTQAWGWSETVPVTGDYDGDGKADCAVYWADGGQWYILQSASGTGRTQPWGWNSAEACQGDYDGDGKTDVGVFWPETGWWNILQSSDGALLTQNWGWSEAWPVAADYDGDGKFDVTVYAPTAGMWYLWQSQSQAQILQPWGWSEALPVNE